MQLVDHVSLRFEPNGRFHEDVVLRVGDWRECCDSYYLMLDNALLPEREDEAKVQVVLRRLLQQWSDAVSCLSEGGSCFLPYDFSDQYIAGLRCAAEGPLLKLQPGWVEVPGYSVLVSDLGGVLRDAPGFRPVGEEFGVSRAIFMDSISQ